MNLNEVVNFVRAAVEASVYIAPTDPGLTRQEIEAIGKEAGFLPGELNDALHQVSSPKYGEERFLPDQSTTVLWLINQAQEPEYRNFKAFDFVISELQMEVRSKGALHAQLDRNVIVDRAVAAGLSEHDAEVAITVMRMSSHLTEKDGVIRFERGHESHPLPGAQLTQGRRQARQRKDLIQAYPLVEHIIGQRATLAPTEDEQAEPKKPFLGKLMADTKRRREIEELFAEYDELVRDVLASRHQSFQANLKRWLRFLDGTAPFAAPILQKLESAADFPTWFEPYRIGMFGGFNDVLEWPEQREKEIGTQLLLMRQFASDAVSPGEFAFLILRTGSNINDGIREINGQIVQPLSASLRRYLKNLTEGRDVVAIPEPDAIPAADRYVTLDHNSPTYRNADESLKNALDAVRSSNDYPDLEDKEQRIAELSAGRALLQSARVRVAAVTAFLLPTLKYLAKKFADVAIGIIATGAIAYLAALLGHLL
jgi:hypothetical protein